MSKMADSHRLLRREGNWYYVRRVPQHLIPAIGKKVVKLSLGTKDKAEAKQLRTIQDLKTDLIFADAAAKQPAGSVAMLGESKVMAAAALIDLVRSAIESDDELAAKELREALSDQMHRALSGAV